MKAVCWHGRRHIRVDRVDDAKIKDACYVISKITATAICVSDLYLYNGVMPTMEPSNVVAHKPMGVIVKFDSAITNFKLVIASWQPSYSLEAHAFFATTNCINVATIPLKMLRSCQKR